MVRKKRTIKFWIGQLHLWLGLASGLVVFIVSVTGCIFAFQQEITQALHKEWYRIPGPEPSQPTRPLSLEVLKGKAELALGHPVSTIVVFREPGRVWEFMAYKENDTALTIFGGMEYYNAVYLDPYTGAVTGIRNYKYDFFSIIKYLHWSLLLNTPYGQPIVGWSTVLFVILLITGMVLWWPKKWTRSYRDRSFKIKWKASLRRVNYDLHNVPGFFSLIPALIIAVTGLVFFWPPRMPGAPVMRSVPAVTTVLCAQTVTVTPLDRACQEAFAAMPVSPRILLSPAMGKEGVIDVYAYKDDETYYGYDVFQFDQYDGRQLDHWRNVKKSRLQRLVEMNYDLHVGAIGGCTGKIIAFIASLICASLPVTGFLIWWLKRKRGIKIA